MDGLLEKIERIGIAVGLIFVLTITSIISYGFYINECEFYNDFVIKNVVEVEKGLKDIEEIRSLRIPENIKQSMEEYYSSRFYSNGEMVEIPANIELIDKISKNKLKYQRELENGRLTVNDKSLKMSYEDFMSNLVGDTPHYQGFSDEDIEFCLYLQKMLLDENNKTTNGLYKKDGKLCMYPETYVSLNGVVYYKGILLDTVELTKKTKLEAIKETKDIRVNGFSEDKSNRLYFIYDDLNNNYSVKAKMKLGKIQEIEFTGF